MIRPKIIADGLGIPNIVIFDGDLNEKGSKFEQLHLRDNVALLTLCNADASQPFPAATIWSTDFVCWPENFGKTVESELRASLGDKEFELVKGEVCKEFDFAGNLNKTSLYIGTLLTIAVDRGAASPSLDRVCDWIAPPKP